MTDKDLTKQTQLSALRISLMYFSVLMGAGFASGKEMWQFFGVFGFKGFFGIILIAFFFISLGFVIVSNAHNLGTGDLSKIIFPFDHLIFENIVAVIVGAFLFLAYFSMLAAGGALIQEQFGIHRVIGSFTLMCLVFFTAFRGFGRVSSNLGKIVPILLIATLIMAVLIIGKDFKNISGTQVITASPLAPNWLIAAIVFVSYNIMGAIPILGSCAIHSTKGVTVKKGAILGGVFLGSCALILYLVALTDPMLSQNSPLPMLSLSLKISRIVGVVYCGVLLISIFGTAVSCFYGFSTKLPNGPKKHRLLVFSAIAGFGCSLLGFSNIVAILYPIEGYLGLVIIMLMIWNYIRIKGGKRI